ncbi:threonine-phosphate decarboxylase CobD [Roseixanthobacter glucoisosaccharinicivorans]|uniref:threonine-phosphate decarboxylase CobD n=1 Tax=Roseixanthobacter glucoisosaccharinicivorans TaxID=3119923 RepID=UPI003727F8C9
MPIDACARQDTASHPAIFHGGDLSAARLRFPNAPEPWIDLSTGINPQPYPLDAVELPPTTWTRLPEPAQNDRLHAVAAGAYGLADTDCIVAASGTQPLLRILPQILPARQVAILGFGYQEHPACWRAAGAEVRIVEAVEDLHASDIDVAVVINPNNPDGRLTPAGMLADLAGRLAARGGRLIVDEAFMEVVRPSQSLAPSLPQGAIVLRSFGKAYGLAGVRLSFAIADAPTIRDMRDRLGPWPVSGPALAVGTRALADRQWLADAVARLETDAARLDGLLAGAGLRVRGGTPLFRLVATPQAAMWVDRLGRAGIHVRAFTQQPQWLRFGLPGPAEAWRRLEKALAR